MARLNLTLDDEVSSALRKHAKREGKPQAAVARELIRAALLAVEERAKRHKLARDYASGRADAQALLSEMEPGELEIMDSEDD
jgi:plasmid stability protein